MTGMTDQDGRFVFNAWRLWRYRVDVQKTGFASHWIHDASENAPVTAGQGVDNISFVLQKAPSSPESLDQKGDAVTDAHVNRVAADHTARASSAAPRLIPAAMLATADE